MKFTSFQTCCAVISGRLFYRPLFALVLAVLSAPLPAAEDTAGKMPELAIDGVEGKPLENVRASMRLAAEPCDAPRWRLRRLFEVADEDIKKALRPFGYYAPRVASEFSKGEACWSARFSIDIGAQVHWSRVDIELRGEVENDPAFKKLLTRVQPNVGDPLDHAVYETVKAELLLLAAARGYRDGEFTTSQLRVDAGAGTAEAILHFDSGPRYRFGEVNFEQDAFDPEFIQRFNDISAGDFYDAAAVIRLQRDLMDSNLFTVVEVKPDYGPNNAKRVPVHVRLVPRKQHAYLVGAGITTDEGPRLRLGYENRRVNRRGHTWEAALRASSVRGNLDFTYNIPLRDPRSEQLSLQAGYQEEHDDDRDSELYKLGVRHMRRHRDGLLQTLFLEAINESFEAGTDSGQSTLFMPGVSWDMRSAGKSVAPKRGWRLELELKAASEALLSDVDFLRGYVRMKGIESLLGGRLIGRGELGFSLVGDFDELPVSQRFYAGGDNSVRGYGYRSLGPLDVNGDVLGGSNLLTASIEYERPVSGPWSVAVFADTGNAFDDTEIDLHHAVGIGVRWRSPVGPIRLDLAHPLDKDEDAIRIHFSLGPDL
jgi:translocation and assembly module TamA